MEGRWSQMAVKNCELGCPPSLGFGGHFFGEFRCARLRLVRLRRARGFFAIKKTRRCLFAAKNGWRGRIRTYEWQNQNLLTYHLSTRQFQMITTMQVNTIVVGARKSGMIFRSEMEPRRYGPFYRDKPREFFVR